MRYLALGVEISNYTNQYPNCSFGRINYKLRYYVSGVRVQVLVEFFLTNFT